MKKVKLKLHNERMLIFMDYCLNNKVKGIKNESEFLKRVGYEYVSNISQLRSGTRGFTFVHVAKCCEVFGADGNFFLMKKHMNMLLKNGNSSALSKLQEAVALVALELKN